MLSRSFLDFSVGCRDFCHRTESDLFLFLFMLKIVFPIFVSTGCMVFFYGRVVLTNNIFYSNLTFLRPV